MDPKTNNSHSTKSKAWLSSLLSGNDAIRLLFTTISLSAFVIIIAWSKWLSGYRPSPVVNFMVYAVFSALLLYWFYLLMINLPVLMTLVMTAMRFVTNMIKSAYLKQKRRYYRPKLKSLTKEQQEFVEKYVCVDYWNKPIIPAIADVLSSSEPSGSRAILVFYCAQTMLKWINNIPNYQHADSCFPKMVGSRSNYFEQKKEEKLFFDLDVKLETSKALRDALQKYMT